MFYRKICDMSNISAQWVSDHRALAVQSKAATRQRVWENGSPLLTESSSEAYAACRYIFRVQNWIKSNLVDNLSYPRFTASLNDT